MMNEMKQNYKILIHRTVTWVEFQSPSPDPLFNLGYLNRGELLQLYSDFFICKNGASGGSR